MATIVNPAWLSRRRAAARQAPPGLPRRPRRPVPRPARMPTGRARDGRGRRDDGRRPLGSQPASLGLAVRIERSEGRRLFGSDPAGYDAAVLAIQTVSTRFSSSAAASGRARPCSRSAPVRVRQLASCSSSAPTHSSPSSRTSALADYLAATLGESIDVRRAPLEDAELPRASSTSPQPHRRSTGSTRASASRRIHERFGRAAGLRSGGRCSARAPGRMRSSGRPAHSSTASSRARRRASTGRPPMRSMSKLASRRSKPPASRLETRARPLASELGHRRHPRLSTAASRRFFVSSADRRRRSSTRSLASRNRTSEVASSRTLTTSLYTARKPS